MNLISLMRDWRLAGGIRQRQALYRQAPLEAERLNLQLQWWNEEWQRVSARVPYYWDLRQRLQLPARFESWQEFVEKVPVTQRALVQKHGPAMACPEPKPDFKRITGGSTAEPIQLPAWNSESQFTSSDLWLARSWYGVRPSSRLFLLWGHSHLLGSGWRGWLNGQVRETKDNLLDYCRFSAYDLRAEALRRAAQRIRRFKPRYVVGYSVALDLFARANQDRRMDLHALKLKAVIGAAEGFPAPDSVSLLQSMFGCPVGMEYGSVETGLMAHTHPSGGYQAFWRTYFIEAEKENEQAAAWKIRVTSLYPRCFPLVRYELGDEILFKENADSTDTPHSRLRLGVTEFEKVAGRCNDFVQWVDGAQIHSELFTHAVRACARITGYQVVQTSQATCIHYLAAAPLGEQDASGIQERLAKIHPGLAGIEIRRVDHLEQTRAGKIRMVIRR